LGETKQFFIVFASEQGKEEDLDCFVDVIKMVAWNEHGNEDGGCAGVVLS
jgi:hypothetical protein